MADKFFSCPVCGGDISLDEESSGKSVSCPRCASRITVTSAKKTGSGDQSGVNWTISREQTVATTIKSSHRGVFPDGKGAPRQMTPPRSSTVQGGLPVLSICSGVFVSWWGTTVQNDRAVSIGAVLALGGVAWGVVARRISERSERTVAGCPGKRRGYDEVIMDRTTRNWHKTIIADAERLVGRTLTNTEATFITRRGGYVALEMIHDTIRAGTKEEIVRYLNSEA
ncbi:MAG: hypothetical protein ACYC9Y_04630 [Candidatus Methylomirabilia bacterium]